MQWPACWRMLRAARPWRQRLLRRHGFESCVGPARCALESPARYAQDVTYVIPIIIGSRCRQERQRGLALLDVWCLTQLGLSQRPARAGGGAIGGCAP